MIISDINDFQPSFRLFPLNDNTTGYRPIALPMILIVPKRRAPGGAIIPNSEVFLTKTDAVTAHSYAVEGIRIKIENVPSEARIVGQQYITPNGNRRFPDRELYSTEITGELFTSRLINLTNPNLSFFRLNGDDEQINVNNIDAKDGDYFTYRTLSGVEASLKYLEGADYYDFSVDQLTDIRLLPDGYYNVVYETEYYRRTILNSGSISQYICIDTLVIDLAFNSLRMNHPGQILSEFNLLTPHPYMTDDTPDVDKTIAFYRPFTTALQDIYDEQDLLEIVNWLYEAPAELLPYLSYQLGWDIPFFPNSLDRQRRAVLRKTTSLQQTKGTRDAIVRIFNLFGFDILLSNLWFSLDNKRLIRPNEKLPPAYEGQEVTESKQIQFETVVGEVSADSPDLPGQEIFYRFDTNVSQKFLAYYSYFLFRPQKQIEAEDLTILNDGGNVNLYAIKVTKGSEADKILKALSSEIFDDPADFAKKLLVNDDRAIYETMDGSIYPKFLMEALAGKPILGMSNILITGMETTLVRILNDGFNPPFMSTNDSIANLNRYLQEHKPSGSTLNYTQYSEYDSIPQDLTSLKYERSKNKLYFTFDTPIDVTESVYMFAAYDKAEYGVPVELINRRSNYFDLELFLSGTTEQIDPTTLNFAIDFLNKVKAMHSLLRTIRQRINLFEDYEVTDFTIGGDTIQRYNTDAGMLQVPPAIRPLYPTGLTQCFNYSPLNLGYKEADIILRQNKLARLEAEYLATETLDRIPFSATRERIKPNVPQDTQKGKYAQYSQDRIITGTKYTVDDEVKSPDPNTNQFIGQPSDNDRTNPGYDVVLDDVRSVIELTTNRDSGLLYKFNRQSTDKGKTLETLDNVTDYTYRGRVDDPILYVQDASMPEEYRSMMCGLRLGSGVYYSYPYLTGVANPGTRNPAQNSMTNYLKFTGNGPEEGIEYFKFGLEKTYYGQSITDQPRLEYDDLLGKLYRNYPNKADNTIHFFNDRYNFDFDQRHNQAFIRRPIQIDKPILHFPGTRFPVLSRLQADYTSSAYRARPWDDAYSTYCGPRGSCGTNEPSFLNVRQVAGTDGNTFIVFDDLPFTALGNNFTPDIPGLGQYTGPQDNGIIHKVYMGGESDNPAVAFDQVCDFDSNVDQDGMITVVEPLFPFVYDGVDYADGYPCVSGIQSVDVTVDYEYQEAVEGLGVPIDTTGYVPVLFLLGSGVRCDLGYRLSCPILNDKYNNDYRLYIDQNGDLQTDGDLLNVSAQMVLDENIGIRSLLLDGSIPTLMEMR